MIEDDVLRGVRAAREAYARLHNFDVGAMVADLRARNLAGDWPVVRHPPRCPHPVAAPEVAPIQTLRQTGSRYPDQPAARATELVIRRRPAPCPRLCVGMGWMAGFYAECS